MRLRQCCARRRGCSGRRAANVAYCGGGIGHRDRHIDVNRPLTRLGGDGDGLVGDHIGSGCIKAEAGLGDRCKNRLLVEHLMGVGLRLIRIDAAGQHQHWHPVLMSIGHHIDPVQRTGAKCRHQNSGGAIAMMHAFAHKPGAVFVFGEVKTDSGTGERVHKGQNFTAGHAKGVAAACVIKTAGQNIGGAKRLGHQKSVSVCRQMLVKRIIRAGRPWQSR